MVENLLVEDQRSVTVALERNILLDYLEQFKILVTRSRYLHLLLLSLLTEREKIDPHQLPSAVKQLHNQGALLVLLGFIPLLINTILPLVA
jgi:hypothetical protein